MKVLKVLAFLVIVIPFVVNDYAQDSRDEIISVFRKKVEIVKDFQSSISSGISHSGKSYQELRKECEDYHENVFLLALESAKKIICEKKDEGLLKEFFLVLIADTGSADETPSWILGDIFLCQSDLVVSEYNKLDKSNKKIIYNHLEFGFTNVTWEKEESILNFSSLKSKLDSLKNQ